MSVVIRRAELKDVNVLSDLFLQHSNLDVERAKILRKILKDARSELTVAELKGEIVGSSIKSLY